MRRLLLALGLVAAFAVPAGAQATTTTEQFTFDLTQPLCNGHLVHVSGPLLVVMTENQTQSGGELIGMHFQPQGIAGTDLSDGTVFHATGITRDLTVNTPPGGTTETFVNRFHLQATQGAQSFIVSETLHLTVTPDGTLTTFIDNFSATC
jgi:hypothetical protein